MVGKIRVIVVDDSRLMREMFSRMLSSDPMIEVIATAEDPFEAREKIKQLNPDVITLDVEMPKMDGITFLEKIMTLRPMPVVMVSTLTRKGADITLRALEIGAVDYMAKPTADDANLLLTMRDELVLKVKTAARSRVRLGCKLEVATTEQLPFDGRSIYDFIAIGASTGGVEAIREVLKALPPNTPPIVITQHMPEHFTASFAERLDKICAVKVQEATHNQHLQTGNVYIAPGNLHMEVKRGRDGKYFCYLRGGENISGHRPSVDVLFSSVAESAGNKAMGVILTGMGKDGSQGLLAMHRAGSPTLGQNEASCVVYGMPKAAHLIGAVDEELPLEKIAAKILAVCKG